MMWIASASSASRCDSARVTSVISDRALALAALHDKGYASIGCAPCTQPGSGREGRWAGSDKVECGLHVA